MTLEERYKQLKQYKKPQPQLHPPIERRCRLWNSCSYYRHSWFPESGCGYPQYAKPAGFRYTCHGIFGYNCPLGPMPQRDMISTTNDTEKTDSE